MSDPELARRLKETIDRDTDELVTLTVDLGNTPSTHGNELEVATKVVDWFRRNGIDAYTQPITERSANAIATVPGASDGTSLIMDAHIDTGGDPSPTASEMVRRLQGAWVEGDIIYGLGVVNCKAQVAAFMVAARAFRKAGIKLQGDLIVAGAAFETSAQSDEKVPGISSPGEGFGSRWLIDRGITADYALIGETSNFGIVAAECGNLLLRIRQRGRTVYTPRLNRGATVRDNPNSIERTGELIIALRQWAIGYEQRARVEFYGGVIIPKAQIKEIRGTGRTTDVHLEVRLAPRADPRLITREVRQLVRDLGMDCEVMPYQWSRGFIAEHAEPLIASVEAAHRDVIGTKLAPPPPPVVSMWRDLNAFNEVGIPSICYGPARQFEPHSDGQNGAMKIADLVAATKVYALTALSVCGAA